MYTDKSYKAYLEKSQSNHGRNGNAEREGAVIKIGCASAEDCIIIGGRAGSNCDSSGVSSVASKASGGRARAIKSSASGNIGISGHTSVSSRDSGRDFALHAASSEGDIIIRSSAHSDGNGSGVSRGANESGEGWAAASRDEASSDIGVSGHSSVSSRNGGRNFALVDSASREDGIIIRSGAGSDGWGSSVSGGTSESRNSSGGRAIRRVTSRNVGISSQSSISWAGGRNFALKSTSGEGDIVIGRSTSSDSSSSNISGVTSKRSKGRGRANVRVTVGNVGVDGQSSVSSLSSGRGLALKVASFESCFKVCVGASLDSHASISISGITSKIAKASRGCAGAGSTSRDISSCSSSPSVSSGDGGGDNTVVGASTEDDISRGGRTSGNGSGSCEVVSSITSKIAKSGR